MFLIVSRAMSWMSTYVSVVISPETTTRPVLTSVSQATRALGSSRRTASRTPSEIWSAILSGCPSVTDSDVNRYSLSDRWVMRSGGRLRVGNVSCGARERWRPDGRPGQELALGRRLRVARDPARPATGPFGGRRAAARAALVEVDDERDAVHPEAGPQAVLEEVRVVARHPRARVHLHREARRRGPDLRHVQELQAMALLRRRLALLDELGDEAVELGGRDAVVHPVAERDRLGEHAADVAAGQRARGQHLGPQPELLRRAGALVVEVSLLHRRGVPLVEDEGGRRPLLHRELR